ncbi:hypothetical protein NDU88_000866 [Pleurodeles waltl]|uniref:Uncharacterized protein n=1 Tax=Pleurodeles waltl TaxID=8319 RepID=A0AAV7VA44_PLEWA|nr:hypothetical protein NDU88_000866 [Pleurodeles waltl]
MVGEQQSPVSLYRQYSKGWQESGRARGLSTASTPREGRKAAEPGVSLPPIQLGMVGERQSPVSLYRHYTKGWYGVSLPPVHQGMVGERQSPGSLYRQYAKGW